uniref:Polynucleotide 5'-hydroxyl-kinase NOL9 n=1 Tax=Timema genevievae TaxID=629358 RepID=A0A7R9K8E0_TIMGE|nr:unnamed protein product [Timema genevievae]
MDKFRSSHAYFRKKMFLPMMKSFKKPNFKHFQKKIKKVVAEKLPSKRPNGKVEPLLDRGDSWSVEGLCIAVDRIQVTNTTQNKSERHGKDKTHQVCTSTRKLGSSGELAEAASGVDSRVADTPNFNREVTPVGLKNQGEIRNINSKNSVNSLSSDILPVKTTLGPSGKNKNELLENGVEDSPSCPKKKKKKKKNESPLISVDETETCAIGEGNLQETWTLPEDDQPIKCNPQIIQVSSGHNVKLPPYLLSANQEEDEKEESSTDHISSVLNRFSKTLKARKKKLGLVVKQVKSDPGKKSSLWYGKDKQTPPVVKVQTDKIAMHKLPNGSYLLAMSHPDTLYLCGKLKVTALLGSVKILGYVLNYDNSKAGVNVFTPEHFTLINIECCKSLGHTDEARENMRAALKSFGMENLGADALMKQCDDSDSVLLLHRLSSELVDYLNTHYPIKLFPKVSSTNDRRFYKAENQLQCLFELPDTELNEKLFNEDPSWDQLAPNLSEPGTKTVVCGGKGVGKSTFLRYMVNSSLTRHDAVLFLDVDPGQSEFSVPGCVSAVIVKEPLLGPNFTHLQQAARLVFVGDIDVAKCPFHYLECVRNVAEFCWSDPELRNMPWFINTMGFTQGLGLELLFGVLHLVRPTHLYELKSARNKHNFLKPLSCEYMNQHHSFWQRDLAASDLDYASFSLDSVAVQTIQKVSRGLKPKECRDLVVLAYLSTLGVPLHEAVPYVAPLARLKLAVTHETVHFSHVLSVMNANLVALCVSDSNQGVTADDPSFPMILTGQPVAPCLGFGIVRGVSLEESQVYLVTPLSGDKLAGVNCLLKGAIDLPPNLYWEVESGSFQVPYVAVGPGQPTTRTIRRVFRPIRKARATTVGAV